MDWPGQSSAMRAVRRSGTVASSFGVSVHEIILRCICGGSHPQAKRSFPVCMSNLHDNLKRNHHLKYEGRMQYVELDPPRARCLFHVLPRHVCSDYGINFRMSGGPLFRGIVPGL